MSALTALLRLELHPHLALLQRSQHKFSRHINQEKETAMRSLFFGDNGHRSRAISRVLCANLRRCRNAGFGLLARLSFIWTCRRRQAQSFYPPSRTLKCSDEPPSDDGIRELSTPDVHSPYCHQMAGGLLHTPSHPYRPKPAVVFFCTD